MSSYHHNDREESDRRYRKRVHRFRGGHAAGPGIDDSREAPDAPAATRAAAREPRSSSLPHGWRR